MALKAWYWLKRVFVPVPHVRVPTAAFFTDVKATVYAEQLTILDAAAFGCSDISELGLSLPEAEQSPDSVTFQHLSEWTVRTILAQSCPKLRARIVSHFIQIAAILHQMRNVHSEAAILSALSSAPIERLKGTWSRVSQEPTASFSHSVGAAVLSPRDGHGLRNVQDGKGV
ncbi:ras-specific guanine nucleotide-releasing factor RalGPS2 [Trichonephila inaurata madagascariensis]|uniref:Ras-specific guanine nucleotide-releasing factor RalGPS2 n=1 Tax=Trichonephila inaurata madagascariensis TaxID=2747483 RepID=A0A8X6ICZ3_9ARAC|nr:ras-specific guanine nucleotide-releasing factor RalGPS2 [Trichonephila inaurata madagascariensis]